MAKSILIIKTGFVETMTNEQYVPGEVSLGDVLRTTVILHLFEGCNVTWLTSPEAAPLLEGNTYINNLLVFEPMSIMQLQRQIFDVVVNLEKVAGMCAFADSIEAGIRYGFRFDRKTAAVGAYSYSEQVLLMSMGKERIADGNSWSYHLYKMLGSDWDGQGYVLNTPKVGYHRLVGLNYMTGSKFEGKRWDTDNWHQLMLMCMEKCYHSVIQPKQTTLENYIKWIAGCELIVSCDSLGLHLAIAMNKWVVGLFGPTASSDIHKYDKGVLIQKKRMSEHKPEEVFKCLDNILKKA